METWPLVLPHQQIKRMLDRHADQLILTARVRPGSYQIQDALIQRQNDRRRRAGRHAEQADPTVLRIRIIDVSELRLIDVDLGIVRRAGYKTQRDFYQDWLERRRHIDPDTPVRVCKFTHEAGERYLHQRVHRGYTDEPAQGARGEPAALSAAELAGLARGAARRLEQQRAAELAHQRARSIGIRIKEAARRHDSTAYAILAAEFAMVAGTATPGV
jgi:hypothetical protein